MAEGSMPRPTRVIARREALALLGVAGFGSLAAACGSDSDTSARGIGGRRGSSVPSATGTTGDTQVECVLAPEMTEGPYYLAHEAMRNDITDGRPGRPLELKITVGSVGSSRCTPIAGANVDIWHADATGNYSGFGSTAPNTTFLRGVQTTDRAGAVTFATIYPGWYQGRAVHIHVKVFTGATAVHTGQLFFDDQVNAAVFADAPYDSRGANWMRNADDGIYRNGGSQSLVAVTRSGSGYTGAITLGVRDQI